MDDGGNHAPLAPASQEPDDETLDALAADAAAVVLSDREKLVLQLYHQVRELELESSLLQAQQNDTTSAPSDEHLSDDEVAQQLIAAERAAMEARASYMIRNKITDQVLTMDPVIKAVHGGSTTSFEERRLAPLLTPRDALSMHLSHQTHALTTTATALATAAKALSAANAKNAALAATLLSLTADHHHHPSSSSSAVGADGLGLDPDLDPKLRDQLLEAERDAARARRRWRGVKGVVAGVVAGSGVDWAADEGLRGLVLEEDEDEDEDELVFDEGEAMAE
ncbi:uncharacterized protein BKCO1_200055 [Diplodia corticola]|uniref:Centromere protein H C-terminal domain-containing protein n=1 Tax=Diplodia corticola TaxID=236234 RepID=A0A1J9SHZ6_9PEZI|nr:uncharacterized protein BKCO1_200055 [Diplodia corticola]OJD39991.1 hypothetical protein BKCO1_200055 [Diplodia corticola]